MGKKLILLIILLCSMVVNVEAQVTPAIKQKGNNVGPPGLSNIGVLPCVATAVDPVYIEGNQVGCSVRLNGTMRTDTSAAAATYLDADGIANQTASAVHGQTYFYNGVTWDRLRGTIAGGILVNCVTGCGAGASTPTDAFANPVTAGLQMGFNMMWNGVTWDRMRGTIAGGLLVDVSDAFLLDATFTTRINTLGQKVMASSTPVVIASDQSSIPITAATLPLPTGAATEATLATRLADATFTGRFVAATLDADAIANQTTTSVHGMGYMYNGVTWDRIRGAIATGLLVNVSNASLAVTGTFFQATQPVSIAGTVSIQGVKSNNAVVPGANNNGTLPCVATAAAPAYTDTFQVACSITLTGDTRVISKTVTLSTTGQQAVTAVATALPANSGREVCIKVVSSGTQTVFYGIAGVTTATGQELLPGEKFCAPVSNSSQFVVIAGGAGSTVAFEVYN